MTFILVYCFFAIQHGRRKILHVNTTCHPAAEWVVQQLRETFPEAGQYRYVILDRDSKFDAEVITCLKATGEANAHEHPLAVAKWHCRTLGRKVSV